MTTSDKTKLALGYVIAGLLWMSHVAYLPAIIIFAVTVRWEWIIAITLYYFFIRPALYEIPHRIFMQYSEDYRLMYTLRQLRKNWR